MSVGVATCGRPVGLARCLRALAAETEPPGEIIVVDQAPSDEARTAVAESGLENVTYLEQERLGLSASRNLALWSATRPVVAVTDDDCVPDPGWVGAIAGAIDRHPAAAAVSGPVLTLGEAQAGTFSISLRDSDVPVDYSGRVIPWVVGSGGNFAARASVLRGVGGWDERLGTGSAGRAAEDAELFLRLLQRGATVRYEPGAVVRHDWQTLERRMATRWSYGYGVGAMCGLVLARGEPYALAMILAYVRYHGRRLLGGLRRRERLEAVGRVRALAAVVPGVAYGLRAAHRPARSIPVGA